MAKNKTKTASETPAPQIIIEDGIEVPARTRPGKYPVEALEVGQSFRLPDGVAGAGLYKRGKRFNVTITIRTMPDGSRRVFRTE